MERVNYRIETEPVTTNGVIDAKNCNEVIFINKGPATVEIDGFPLANNEFLTDGGNFGEFNTTRYRITFPAGASVCWVRRKYYVK